jgi:hypothetical protein
MATFLEIATPLAQRGLPVIPVQPNDKACLLPNWQKKATTDPDQIAAWNRENPNYNVGCVGKPEGFVILDCDVKGLMERIQRESRQQFPKSLIVCSAGKKCHHAYFRQTALSRKLGNQKAAGLFDLQSVDKYVVGPGSRLANGNTYDIVEDCPSQIFPTGWTGGSEATLTFPRTAAMVKMRSPCMRISILMTSSIFMESAGISVATGL